MVEVGGVAGWPTSCWKLGPRLSQKIIELLRWWKPASASQLKQFFAHKTRKPTTIDLTDLTADEPRRSSIGQEISSFKKKYWGRPVSIDLSKESQPASIDLSKDSQPMSTDLSRDSRSPHHTHVYAKYDNPIWSCPMTRISGVWSDGVILYLDMCIRGTL